ncbi:MAG: DUF5455 family protein [Gammaproteobacteria bacterium]
MPFLYSLISGLLGGLFTWISRNFLEFIAKRGIKIAVLIAFAALFLASTVAYVASMRAIASGISQTVPSEVLNVWGWVMPDNTFACISAIFLARLTRWAYDNYQKLITLKAKSLSS